VLSTRERLTDPPVRQRFTLAHELGHLVYDVYPNIDDSNYDEVITDGIVRLRLLTS